MEMQDEAIVVVARPEEAAAAAVVAVRRMNSSGVGKMSYADNSDFQRVIASVTKKARQELAAALYRARGRPDSMAIADLGCATGPNALLNVSDAVEAVLAENQHHPPPQLHVFLNDLPANDFNAVFRLLPSSPLAATGCCLVSAWPGSFYERVFPEASLDYVVSSSSLHFLSKAPTMRMEHPVNLGRVYVSESGPAAVLDAYRSQFHADFLAFLSCRAVEVRPRGLLLLTFVARRTARPTAHDCYLWDLLADALMDMAAAGLVDEDQVHAFNAPYYSPCPDDLAKVIAKEGSFTVRTMQLFVTTRRCLLLQAQAQADDDDDELPRWLAMETASTVRAVVEPMLRTHFGWDAIAMDGLFCRYSLLLEAYYRSNTSRNKDDLTNVFLVLEKKQH
ncbi:hypothetical protein BDA96_09G000900 [Sorghum bicolor]|jgi:jasmonate O-methyltransferase|uniref:Jasmonate O-methyltransferase n=2 Tax=Sorghum bicolor TaxID=4558 RepID=A0A921U3A0_SORBI|nr:salicylate carboxymethyltransferase [Sorghum bicolor]EES18827.1 hypothetical protein SORBI_3009G000900 [Sorghum bicolor]KAG0516414.1 hypothetical protein BDA96_09G000900 [Sorghum bicolor]|eukprot:XP_002440397.1 salicylate carboxymethyltransferase [Sorghum bicolor]